MTESTRRLKKQFNPQKDATNVDRGYDFYVKVYENQEVKGLQQLFTAQKVLHGCSWDKVLTRLERPGAEARGEDSYAFSHGVNDPDESQQTGFTAGSVLGACSMPGAIFPD